MLILAIIDVLLLVGLFVLAWRVEKLEASIEKMNADMFWSTR